MSDPIGGLEEHLLSGSEDSAGKEPQGLVTGEEERRERAEQSTGSEKGSLESEGEVGNVEKRDELGRKPVLEEDGFDSSVDLKETEKATGREEEIGSTGVVLHTPEHVSDSENPCEEAMCILSSEREGEGVEVGEGRRGREADGGLLVTEAMIQYLAVHQELLLRPVEEVKEEELLRALLGEELTNAPKAEELLREFPLLSLLHGKHSSQGRSEESFWINVAHAIASGVPLKSTSTPSVREFQREDIDRSKSSAVTRTKSSVRYSGRESECNERSEGKSSRSRAIIEKESKAREQRESDTGEGQVKSDRERREAAAALSVSGRESLELEMDIEDEDSIVMEAGEKQNPARYIVSAVMAVVKIVIVLALLREYEAPLLFYLYPLLWVFIFVLLLIRAAQILIANRAIDKANALLATELLPLDPHSDEDDEIHLDNYSDDEEEGRGSN